MTHKNRFSFVLPYFPALVSGGLLTAAFPDTGLFYLAFIALVPLWVSLGSMTPGQAFYAGLITGMSHFLSLIYWIVPTMTIYGGLHPVLAAACLVLLSLYLSLYPGIFAFFLKKSGLPPWLAPLGGSFIWVGLEFIRTHALTGFPWGVLGYSQFANTLLVQCADIFGVLGISFILVFCNGGLVRVWLLILEQKKRQGLLRNLSITIGCLIMILSLALGYGKFRIATVDRWIQKAPAPRITVVQGNIPQEKKWDKTFKNHTVDQYGRLSLEANQPDLIIWPETALPFYYGRDVQFSNRVDVIVREARSHFLIGSPAVDTTDGSVKYYNRAYMLNPISLVIGTYDKTHLVPFGEYVPLQEVLFFIKKLTAQAGNFSKGRTGTQPLAFDQHKTGVLICFEILFPDIAREFTANGADLLTTMTNDAWFGRTSAPGQHFSIAVLRAVENRRSVIRAANTGISGFIDPTGQILDRTDLFQTTALTWPIPALTQISFYTRHGDLLAMGALVAICLGFMIKGIKKLFRRTRQ